jgi:glucose-6-phosphate dehydrogenase assembly protein OpcA
MPTLTPPNLEEETRPIPLRDIESELTRRVKTVQDCGDTPVLRARMSNLIIYKDRAEGLDEIIDGVPAITAVHPAMVFLLVAGPSDEEGELTARISVRERLAGGGRTAASELVILDATGHAVDRLPYVVRGLALGNLPTNLLWAADAPPAFNGPILLDLAEHAEQFVYDSLGWNDPWHALAKSAGWIKTFERPGGAGGRRRIVSDLAWRRLKPWRRLLSQALDPSVAPGAFESIREIILEHGPGAAAAASLTAGWLASALGWTVESGRTRSGGESSWVLVAPQGRVNLQITRHDEGPGDLQHVRISCSITARDCLLDARLDHDGRRLIIQPIGLDASPRSILIPRQTNPTLIGQQLSDRVRDPAFHHAVECAAILAKTLLG